jgi:hypothetical protein
MKQLVSATMNLGRISSSIGRWAEDSRMDSLDFSRLDCSVTFSWSRRRFSVWGQKNRNIFIFEI